MCSEATDAMTEKRRHPVPAAPLDPLTLLCPRRKPVGMSAILPPFESNGSPAGTTRTSMWQGAYHNCRSMVVSAKLLDELAAAAK
jgi:hypothetical protein